MNYWLQRSYKSEVRLFFLLMTNDFIYNCVSITRFSQPVVESSNVEFILSSIICVFFIYINVMQSLSVTTCKTIQINDYSDTLS